MNRIKDNLEPESKTMSRTVKITLTIVLVVFVLTVSSSSSSSSLFNLIKSATAVLASTPTNANVIAESKIFNDFLDALNMSLKGYR
jgi:hypothetical protein